MALDEGDGSLAGGGAYQKPGQGPGSHEGAIYVVAGNGSEVFDTVSGLHPVMVTSQVRLGSVALDVEGDRIEARMIDDSGTVRDRFTIVKNAASLPQADFSGEPRVGTAPLGVAFTDLSSTNTAAWEWDFDGDGLVDSLLRNPEAIFVEPGLHEVRLTASNLAGTDRETKVDYVCVAATPSSVSGLVLVDPDSLAWDLAVGAASYDVIQGNLGLLLDAGGSFAASGPSCLLANASGSGAVDPEPLQPGQSRYYLVRAVGCADDAGTYDSGGPSQSGPRDESLLSLVCP
jgi:hypothetical protein